MTELTRRSLLAGAAIAGATATLPRSARAAAPVAGTQAAAFYRYKIGSYELTAIHEASGCATSTTVRQNARGRRLKAMMDLHADRKLRSFTTLVVTPAPSSS